MHDDDVTNVERRLRAVLQPDDERVRHVIAGALSPDRQIHRAILARASPLASGTAHLRNWFCPRGDERRWQAMGGERATRVDCPR